jgi:hypothetical protein
LFQPFIFQTPIILPIFGEYWFKYVDNWLSLSFALTFAMAVCTDAWLGISIIGSFRREFKQRVLKRLTINQSSSQVRLIPPCAQTVSATAGNTNVGGIIVRHNSIMK